MEQDHFKGQATNFAYQRGGEGTPLVLIHGFPLDGSVWNGCATLLERSFEVLVPDVRGFGGSTTTEERDTMDSYAADVLSLIGYFGHKKVILAGHSMGGYIALEFASRYPERLSGLGLISTQAVADTPERKQGRYDTAEKVEAQGVQVVVDAMTTKFTANSALQEKARLIMEAQKPTAIAKALRAMGQRADHTSLLASLTIPVVIVHGDADALIPVERAREMKVAIPQATYVELPGGGHLPMMEAVKETAEALKRFVA